MRLAILNQFSDSLSIRLQKFFLDDVNPFLNIRLIVNDKFVAQKVASFKVSCIAEFKGFCCAKAEEGYLFYKDSVIVETNETFSNIVIYASTSDIHYMSEKPMRFFSTYFK